MGAFFDKLYDIKRGMNKTATFFFLIFTLIGIAVLIYSFVLRKEEKDFFANAAQTTATISKFEVHETTDSDGNIKKEHRVYVDYEVDGTGYEDIYLCNYESGMSEGDTVEIYYDPANPSDAEKYYDVDAHYNDIVGVAIFFIIGGALPAIITGVIGSGKNKNKGLLTTGRFVCATVKSIEANYNTKVNGEHPYWVICEEVNEAQGIINRYTSNKVYEDLTRRIAPGDQIAVYVNPDNPDQYYVNLDEII